MRIQFLWWEGCPSHPKARQRLQQALDELKMEAEIEDIQVLTDEEAERWGFPGSPTILVEGQDIDPQGAQQPARLTCRLYFLENGRPSPVPSVEMIKRALQAAQDFTATSTRRE